MIVRYSGGSVDRRITKISIYFLMQYLDYEEVDKRSKKFANLTDTDVDSDDDYSELLVPEPDRSKLRNTDKSLYFRSRKAEKCPLCHKHYHFMVSHFKSQHKKSEVFVSRISPKMVEYINNDKRSYVKSKTSRSRGLQTLCVFCEEEKNFPVHYWVDHQRSHTGEYGNYCSICNKRCSFNNHCGITTTKIDGFDLRINDMTAYRCVDCNFVQTRYKNIRNHLKDQHQRLHIGKQDYKKFILLPAYNHITEQRIPRGDPHPGINTFSINFSLF